ncbi:amino acid synthesis family protein [Nitriliruptor alkaliphilus]|uniref:amino acid synthesis family protein n=1 Tax=Nitriliruptor alkaliphilus TaxID=427918 RepID=UPI000697D270|nr:amino acid synthesis family protein [Nitriliruptor alkaliphilus]
MPPADRFRVRREVLCAEEVHHEGGPRPERPLRRVAALAVVDNPFAGRYEPDLEPVMAELEPLGVRLATRLVEALGGSDRVAGYGKGALVGEDGELEHGALWHVPGGYAMRRALGEALAIVPSAKKVGGPGTRLDVPITHRDASYVRSHFDAMEIGLTSGPAPDELVLALVMTDGPRIHARVGGLTPDQITERNGLR